MIRFDFFLHAPCMQCCMVQHIPPTPRVLAQHSGMLKPKAEPEMSQAIEIAPCMCLLQRI